MSVDDEALGPDAFEGADDDFVPALFARDLDEAEVFCDLLADHDIPARPGTDDGSKDAEELEHRLAGQRGITHGIAVLVPESLLDEASEVIADRDDFSDFEADDEEEEDEEDDTFAMEEIDPTEDSLLAGEEDEEDSLFEEDDGLDDLDDDDEDEDEDDEDEFF